MNRVANSGVEANLGFTLQRNTALYLLLENYNLKFENKKYFICIEHHDDFLFCFLDNEEKAKKIETYQSKKKSPDRWTLDASFFKIITKILKTGKDVFDDEIIKTIDYTYSLHFISNQTVYLESDCLPKKNRRKISIKEDNEFVSFEELDSELKIKIKKNVQDEFHNELQNFNFYWVGLSRIAKIQKETLVGKLNILFGKKIYDSISGIEILFLLFSEVENVHNQKGEIKLLDKTKRVNSEQVEKAFNLITTKGKAFEYWKNHESEIAKVLQIKPSEKEQFKLDFETAFEYFKSIEEAEHRNIFEFVKNNYKDCETYSEHETVINLFDLFVNQKATLFYEKQLKAILYAAFFEVINLKPTE